ncbi:unnamed protein product [Brachionus calyciflorus]|uniref:Uncharacterized protein n=1 Tax=Brachionus calyciflorus TaxID=104777 RepID=A0A813TCI1_9BILA|nr:unnamed protein product [Brachionus calyciflorus]
MSYNSDSEDKCLNQFFDEYNRKREEIEYEKENARLEEEIRLNEEILKKQEEEYEKLRFLYETKELEVKNLDRLIQEMHENINNLF